MESISINYLAVLVCGVASMLFGAIWYGPIFGKKWLEVIGANALDIEKRNEMMKGVWKLYLTQFVLTLFQVFVLAHLIMDTTSATGLQRSLWIWAAFIVPTLAGSAMWNNDSAKISWARFLIQGGYQLVIFIMFGLVLQFWK